jgi:hypothetical protein
LEVPFISTFPGVRAHGTYFFKPGSDEYNQIIAEIGDLGVGDSVTFTSPPTALQLEIDARNESLDVGMARITNLVLEKRKAFLDKDKANKDSTPRSVPVVQDEEPIEE